MRKGQEILAVTVPESPQLVFPLFRLRIIWSNRYLSIYHFRLISVDISWNWHYSFIDIQYNMIHIKDRFLREIERS